MAGLSQHRGAAAGFAGGHRRAPPLVSGRPLLELRITCAVVANRSCHVRLRGWRRSLGRCFCVVASPLWLLAHRVCACITVYSLFKVLKALKSALWLRGTSPPAPLCEFFGILDTKFTNCLHLSCLTMPNLQFSQDTAAKRIQHKGFEFAFNISLSSVYRAKVHR